MIVEQRVGKFQIRELNNHVPRRLGTKGEILSYPDPGSRVPDANPTDSRCKPMVLTKGSPEDNGHDTSTPHARCSNLRNEELRIEHSRHWGSRTLCDISVRVSAA